MNSQRSRDLNELKRQVLNYYSLNADVPKRIEEALNSLFYDSPDDIYGYLSEYFLKYIKPAVISKIHASKTPYYDAKGQLVFRLDVFCQDKNKEIRKVALNSPCNSPDLIHDSTILQYIQEDDTLRNLKLTEVIKFINTEINDVLKNANPFNQREIDEKLTKVFADKQRSFFEKSMLTSSFEHQSVTQMEGKKSVTPSTPKPKPTASKVGAKASTLMANSVVNIQDEMQTYYQKNFFGLFALAFLSKSLCMTSVSLSRFQPFERISQMMQLTEDKYRMPVPMISVLQNGKGFSGKQNLVKEYILMPKLNVKFQDGIDMISKINRNIRDSLLASKTTPGAVNKMVTDQGCLTMMLDAPQQEETSDLNLKLPPKTSEIRRCIEVIEGAISTCFGNFDNSSQLNMALNMAAYEIYEMDKIRYEVAVGLFKSSDELIEQYVDLVKKFPRVVMIIDPFHPSDQVSWYKLHARISNSCLIACTIKNTDFFDNKISEMVNDRQANNSHLEKLSVDDSARTEINIVVTKPLLNYVPLNMPVTFFKFENTITVSSVVDQIKENRNKGNYSGLSCSYNETDDTFLSDLSVGSQVGYIKIGGFNRSERVNKINRLIEIESYLAEKDLLVNFNELNGEIEFLTELQHIPDEYFDVVQSIREHTNQKGSDDKTRKSSSKK